ncbi:MAG: hypothetical protein PQJ46_09110 [Spirochaetales bacterium]|nr:hypothetical protein [Spirochaetales bacterium]
MIRSIEEIRSAEKELHPNLPIYESIAVSVLRVSSIAVIQLFISSIFSCLDSHSLPTEF